MSWWQESVKRKQTLDRFCGNTMTYEPFENFRYDAHIFNVHNKFVGIAKIFSQPTNFGNRPIVEISKDDIDFLYELGLLTAKKPVAIVKFRNKVAYLRLEHVNYGIQEGKKCKQYKIPIGELKCV